MRHEWVVILLSLGAACAFALSSSLKHVSAGEAPDAQSFKPGQVGTFVMATVRHRKWLIGIACDVVGLALQIVALHQGALAVVQPLLVSGLLFALLFRSFHDNHRLTARQMVWALALTAALAGFLVLAGTATTVVVHETADRLPAVVAFVSGAIFSLACVALGRRMRSEGRSAALMGIAVGVIYAATAALLKGISDIAARHPLHLLVSWQLYLVVVLGAVGLLLNQLAFQAGPITASLPATATVDPLVSIAIGVLVYDEHIRRGVGNGLMLLALLAVLGTAVIQLARTPEAA